MTTSRLYRNGRLEEEGFDPKRVSDFLEEPDTFVWLDLEDPTDRDIEMIRDEFSLHELTVEDVENRGQRTKFEPFPDLDYYFLVLYGVGLEGDKVREHEIHVFAGQRFLVTIRYAPALDLKPFLERCERHGGLAKEGAGFLLYALLDAVVDGYFDVVEGIEDLTEEIEEGVFENRADESVQQRIFLIRKGLVTFRRRVTPLREVLNILIDDPKLVTDPLRPYYRDVTDHVLRVVDFLDNVRELLTTALEVRISQVGNRLNEVMKKVTSWGGIILVPTLIAGIYGMNFRFMPELDWPWGYPMALGLMVFCSFMLYRVFRKRGWL